jgi:hypothetical protein
VRWLGFFLDPKFNWQAHVKHRLALRHHRIKTLARVMGANGTPRKLARKVARAVAMSTAAYGVEAIWEGQKWLSDGFDKLTRTIGRTVAGTFSTAKGDDAIRAADTPPTGRTLDRRRERLLASALAAPQTHPNEPSSHPVRKTTRRDGAYPHGIEVLPGMDDWSRKGSNWKGPDPYPETAHRGPLRNHLRKPYTRGQTDRLEGPREWDGSSPGMRRERAKP